MSPKSLAKRRKGNREKFPESTRYSEPLCLDYTDYFAAQGNKRPSGLTCQPCSISTAWPAHYFDSVSVTPSAPLSLQSPVLMNRRS
ncbi:hypothetical protein EGD00_10340 [Pectobacterium carotovorum subsp. carotovorum]|nr:hypothetical protein EGD00_10340 [Pectobacterium carotovorum subsp. carotovorum]